MSSRMMSNRIIQTSLSGSIEYQPWESLINPWKSVTSAGSVCNKNPCLRVLVLIGYSFLCSLFSSKNFTSLCARCRGQNHRIVKARSSHGISHEHGRAGAWQYVGTAKTERRREMNVLNVLQLLRFYFYNPLIINGVLSLSVSAFSIVSVQWYVCAPLFNWLCFNKKSLHSMKGVPQFLIPQSENDKLLFRRYNIYYLYL